MPRLRSSPTRTKHRLSRTRRRRFSKTRRKEAMRELQDLGRALLGLDPIRLAALGLPERLADAVALARKLSKHEARRRQMQYIGQLMRDVDPEPLRAALATGPPAPQPSVRTSRTLERWRDRMLDDPQALDAFSIASPTAPPPHWRRWCGRTRRAHARRAAAKIPCPVSRDQAHHRPICNRRVNAP